MSTASLPDSYRPALPPFKHQSDALLKGWSRRGFFYAMEMGVGKSRTTVDNLCLLLEDNKVDGMVLVAPKSVYANWTRRSGPGVEPGELEKWLWPHIAKDATVYTWVSGKSQKDVRGVTPLLAVTAGVKVLAINAEALVSANGADDLVRRFIRAHRTMLVIDESTLCRNPKSSVHKELVSLARQVPYVRLLSGQPMPRSPVDIWAQMEIMGPKEGLTGHRLLSSFKARYCVMRELFAGGRSIKVEVGAQNLEELARAFERHSFRVRKEDCLDLPPKLYEKREVDLTDEQAQAYRELKKTAMTELQGAQVTTNIVATQLLRLHQVVCGHLRADDGRLMILSNKRVTAVRSIVDDMDRDRQAIIWCRYVPDVLAVVRGLEEDHGEGCCGVWTGENAHEREAHESEFQAGTRRFMVATIQAGARGRTWTRASVEVFYSNSYDLELRQQAEDRAHRIGQSLPVTIIDLVTPGTVDEGILKALREKRSLVQTVLQDGPSDWI